MKYWYRLLENPKACVNSCIIVYKLFCKFAAPGSKCAKLIYVIPVIGL